MTLSTLRDSAENLESILIQIRKSALALTTDDPDVLADIGPKEKARLKSGIEDFFKLLPAFSSTCGTVLAGDLGPAKGAAELAAAAFDLAQQDSNHLQIMGRGFIGREQERLVKERAALPHLTKAVEALQA